MKLALDCTRDDPLQNIFVMNNIHYMVQKVNNSDLKSFLGDDWIQIHNRKFQQQAMRDMREGVRE